MAYKSIKETLYKKFCDSIGRDYNNEDIHDFRDKADMIYNDFSNKVKEFKNEGKDEKTSIEFYKNFYKTARDEKAIRNGKSDSFMSLYCIGANEHILDDILDSILKAAWEDSE